MLLMLISCLMLPFPNSLPKDHQDQQFPFEKQRKKPLSLSVTKRIMFVINPLRITIK